MSDNPYTVEALRRELVQARERNRELEAEQEGGMRDAAFYEKEQRRKKRIMGKMRKVLKEAGIELGIASCGCCNGAHVYFSHNGKALCDWEEDFSFETAGVPEDTSQW